MQGSTQEAKADAKESSEVGANTRPCCPPTTSGAAPKLPYSCWLLHCCFVFAGHGLRQEEFWTWQAGVWVLGGPRGTWVTCGRSRRHPVHWQGNPGGRLLALWHFLYPRKMATALTFDSVMCFLKPIATGEQACLDPVWKIDTSQASGLAVEMPSWRRAWEITLLIFLEKM